MRETPRRQSKIMVEKNPKTMAKTKKEKRRTNKIELNKLGLIISQVNIGLAYNWLLWPNLYQLEWNMIFLEGLYIHIQGPPLFKVYIWTVKRKQIDRRMTSNGGDTNTNRYYYINKIKQVVIRWLWALFPPLFWCFRVVIVVSKRQKLNAL